MPLVHIVTAHIIIAALPVELALAMLQVVVVLTGVLVTVLNRLLLLPLAFPMLHTLAELSNI